MGNSLLGLRVVKVIKIRSFSKRNIPRINHSEEPKSWYVASILTNDSDNGS